ncbi:MAG: DUF2182 domain-containing protein [Chloroflexi bacterium]|nr:MAG: DUF2182 domain-containing protein [Chloroflexota bacterium]TMF17006.1 MAG: DUF2182 domain-containing protein [Chloroflexota bacterium]
MTEIALAAPPTDTPRMAYSTLERRATLTMLALLLSLAAAAWWSTVGNARDMGAMVQGVAGVGIAMPFDMTALVFMGMWTTMMVAMMFPTTAPIVLLHRMVVRRRGEGAAPTIAFGLGYLVIWASVGVIPLAVLLGFRHFSAQSIWIDRVGGSVLLVAGVYQFSHWKETCLRACRTPLTFLMTHDFGRGSMGAFRVGLSHGLYCLGCCWALMAVLFVVGLMNLVWMAAVAGVFLIEKNWRHGVGLTRVVGGAVMGLGIAVLVDPALLSWLAPVQQAGSMALNG